MIFSLALNPNLSLEQLKDLLELQLKGHEQRCKIMADAIREAPTTEAKLEIFNALLPVILMFMF